MTSRGWILPALAALLLAGCSQGSAEAPASSAPSESAAQSASAAAGGASGLPAGSTYIATTCDLSVPPAITAKPAAEAAPGVAVDFDPSGVPVITVAPGSPLATELVQVDLGGEGTGDAATATDEVSVNYCGVGLQTGLPFDSSWARGEPVTFALGNLIKGWQEGIPEMRAGERRLLIIPGDMAYGANPPSGGTILANETLVFVIEMASVGQAPSPAAS